MNKTKTVGDYRLTEFYAVASMGERCEKTAFVLVHDNANDTSPSAVILPVDCLLVGHTLDDFEYEDDVVEVISMECLEAFD